ncbi:hypothetical protein [Amycolatopsis plumensis]|uniref:DUF998 domain-containing protein n=1 Tax=Amycolatopsis plumensis TaxID=236508 RepID=A0ABV5UDK4_9PSEU
MTPIVRSGGAARAGAVLLFIGPLVSWVAELITASAWQEPHYSPFYNWVSDLGLTGPSQVAFGPIAIVVLAILAGMGVSLVGIFQGSNANVANGLIAFHTYGAQGVMLAGNVMAIVVGVNASRLGQGRGRRVASIALGVFGLVAFGAFMADVFTGWAWNIGLFERAVIYPIMIGHVVLGGGLAAARTARQALPHQPVLAGR